MEGNQASARAEKSESESRLVKFGFLFHRITNPVVRMILSSPLHALLSGKLILITYTGRQSGVRHTLPVMYANWDDELVVVVGYYDKKKWWRNFRGKPVAVKIRYRGKLLEGSALAVEGKAAEIVPRLVEYLKKYPASARRRGLDPIADVDKQTFIDRTKSEVMVIIRPSAGN